MLTNSPRRFAAAALLLAAAAFTIGCSPEPELEFADWILPVPEGTPIKEYGPVPVTERAANAVQLIDALIIGSDVNNPDAVLYRPNGIAATADGTMYVADAGAGNVKMFGPDGDYLKTLGREGQGPGEFGRLAGITIAGDLLVVNDSRNRRLSVWSLEGNHIADHVPGTRVASLWMSGLADGTVVSVIPEQTDRENRKWVVVRRSLEGEELSRLGELAMAPLPSVDRSDRVGRFQAVMDSINNPRLIVATGSSEVVYISPARDYQVIAMSGDGATLWALRVAWPRPPFPGGGRQQMIDSFVASGSGDEPINVDEVDWPPDFSAVGALATDGQGRLYVFALEEMDDLFTRPDSWPVDVYSPSGDFIAAGIVAAPWVYAAGDYVYAIRPDENEEMVVVRYRLVIDGD